MEESEDNMLNTTKNTSMNGNSSIEGKAVVTFSASIPSAGEITINKRIADRKAYIENQDECDKDFANFETEVMAAIKEM